MQEDKWKERLLSSGLPLEYVLQSKLESLKLSIDVEFEYQRIDEAGREKTFSVDLHAVKRLKGPIFLEMFLECKYKRPGAKWIFNPQHPSDPLGHRSHFGLYDTISEKIFFESFADNLYDKSLPLVIKGTEIIDNNENPRTIKEALGQIRYAILEYYIDSLRDHLLQRNSLNVDLDILRLFTGIVVTTADLWVMNRNSDIEKILNANSLEEVAQKVPYLHIRDFGGTEFYEYSKHRILDKLVNYKLDVEEFDTPYQKEVARRVKDEDLRRRLLSFGVEQIAICHIDYVADYIEGMIEKIEAKLPLTTEYPEDR